MVLNTTLETENEAEKPLIQPEEPKTEAKPQPKVEEFQTRHFVFEENQTGISYEKLFAPIFRGAKKITIVDPYIRNYYQTINLMELIEVIEKSKPETEIVEVELTTSEDEYNVQAQKDNLETIRESCFQMGIEFSFKFDPTIHARSIVTDNGWRVLLDRGLDIYQNCERKDALQYTTRVQKFRLCKRFEITYLRNK